MVSTDTEILPTFNFDTNIELPVLKGSKVGTVTYKLNNADYVIDIVASEDILPGNSTEIKNIYYVLIGVIVALIIFTFFKKKKYKEPRYFKRSLY